MSRLHITTQKPPRKPLPSLHIVTNLPCPADRDASEIPQPSYAPEDITLVQEILLLFLPPELADAVVGLAEYWPYVGISHNSFNSAYSALDAPDHDAQWCFLVSPPIPSCQGTDGSSLPTTVKMVKFLIKTYDSSWGGRKEQGSKGEGFKTWFETSILKGQEPDIDLTDHNPELATREGGVRPNDWYASVVSRPGMYINGFRDVRVTTAPPNTLDTRKRWHVTDNSTTHHPQSDDGWDEIVWRFDDQVDIDTMADTSTGRGRGTGVGFLNSLLVDDRIILMARALSPGWIDMIFNVKIEIYYAFSSSYL
ncbi:hypothetical protein M413DRAFT_242934 [Hebeloma cylindrosporum]|uniref:Uncharacterized protein n=1 Tax=Hebeloma cylindrosporum TaxID=76867 RepID=A0A0C3C2L8_HEBCY|nr:hypothetical protein M413DRAFT_242934 [Hebeloma cylindrosporum h7]